MKHRTGLAPPSVEVLVGQPTSVTVTKDNHVVKNEKINVHSFQT